MSEHLRGTLRYCLVLFLVLVPVYFLVYRMIWDAENSYAWTTALIYGTLNVLFLGALRHFFVKPKDQ